MNGNCLHLQDVSLGFGPLEVISQISLETGQGEFLAVVGPSGCGKTTLLNLLAGFVEPSRGIVVRRGRVRIVHQKDGLFPWLTTRQNIALGVRHLTDEVEQRRQLQEMLHLIDLEAFADYYPHQLSGGMRQRVELARALIGETDVLLMDEPFSALDCLTRLRMRAEFSRLLYERPRTVVFVTHDIEEAAQLADRVVVLSECPARIRCELSIGLPRPRDLTHPIVVDAVRRLLDEFGLRENPCAKGYE